MAINPIDVSFLVVIVYGVMQGLKKGFIGTILSIAKVGLTLFIALRFSFILSRILDRIFTVGTTFTPILAFILLLVMVGAFFYIIGNALEQFVKAAHLSQFNRGMGIFLWTISIIMGYSTVISMCDTSGLLAEWVKDTSYLYPYIEPFSAVVSCKFGDIFPAMTKILDSFLSVLQGIASGLIGACGLQ